MNIRAHDKREAVFGNAAALAQALFPSPSPALAP